ncbi:DAZ-associated protein 1 isoform X9 [Eptesicus fuscus]|uniref:DAZ-associated protein 1 isoform X9 n=1 Tax=Eptesicus fuscus TaxID=29078 RepID=UPI0024048289|nr:DAZ-associated protein 1 isoform X9 [Eptesicus fuscus]XP_054573539.1 DAZ-associated protein 1 isoform X9 [Eptesicus fuscus]XP_054573540.1 DAZ-associated protein 1 isoform X9 [Eptesicus fuscus]XP_054573541.1 DAZ-associated protein 1 isoform X9 [Eptesicus fuscus]
MNNSGADEIGKLFVGGLDWSTTQETLRSYFSQYGEVVDCVIMKDKTTNQSRGFGFVKFKDPNCVGTVLASRPHTLDGRNIDPKPCTPRGMQPERTRPKEGWQKGSRNDNSKSNKIFVGGIPHNCGETELREYFKKFGVVTEVVMIYDAEKQRPRAALGPGQELICRSRPYSPCPAETPRALGCRPQHAPAMLENSLPFELPSSYSMIKWRLNGLNLATVKVKCLDSQGPASGAAASCPVPPMAGQASPHLRGSKDMAHKECGCQQDRQLVATDRPLREEELPHHPRHSPLTLCPPLLEGSLLHRASHRATAPPHNSVLAMGLHLHRQISLRHQGSPLHLPLLGQHLWPSRRLPLRLPRI